MIKRLKKIAADLHSTKNNSKDSTQARDEERKKMLKEDIQEKLQRPTLLVPNSGEVCMCKYKMIDPNCVKNAGIFFSDEMAPFSAYEFSKDFKIFSKETLEAQMVMAFARYA